MIHFVAILATFKLQLLAHDPSLGLDDALYFTQKSMLMQDLPVLFALFVVEQVGFRFVGAKQYFLQHIFVCTTNCLLFACIFWNACSVAFFSNTGQILTCDMAWSTLVCLDSGKMTTFLMAGTVGNVTKAFLIQIAALIACSILAKHKKIAFCMLMLVAAICMVAASKPLPEEQPIIFSKILNYYEHVLYATWRALQAFLFIKMQHVGFVQQPAITTHDEWIRAFAKPFPLVDDMLAFWAAYKNDSVLHSAVQSKREDDFSMLRRTKSSPIKNVVVVILESTRSDMLPVNYDSPLAHKWLLESAMKERRITPFFDRFIHETMHFPKSKSVISYTVKALHSIFCGTYPFPVHWTVEFYLKHYQTCLPHLMREHGFSTAFFQSSNSYDHQYSILHKAGFDTLVSKPDFPEMFHDEIDSLTLEDEVMLPRIFDWVNNQTQESKPFLLGMHTSVNHYPFHTPNSWQMRTFSNDTFLNQVFNAFAYLDSFLDQFMGQFKSLPYYNDTAFVFLADHGTMLGEEGSYGVTGQFHDNAFTIPIMIHFGNKNLPLNRNLELRKYTEGQYSNIDIVKTILDLLDNSFWKNDKQRKDWNYEGHSLLREPLKNRTTLSFVTPGMTSVIARHDKYKLVVDKANKWETPENLLSLKFAAQDSSDPHSYSAMDYADDSVFSHLHTALELMIHKLQHLFQISRTNLFKRLNY